MRSVVHNIDCMIGMREFPDKYFDLAVCDPPYGIGVNQMKMGDRKTIKPDLRTWDNSIPSTSYFLELKRVSEHQIIWGGNYFDLPPNKCFIIWDKGETMYNRDFAECEQAWASFDKPAKMYKRNPNQLDRIHPTQKPVELYSWIYHNYLPQGGKVLDTHLGSGSNRIAAHKAGNIDFTGYEIDKDYYEAAEKRYQLFISQLTIQF